MTTHIHLCGVLAAMLISPFAGVAAAQGSPAGEEPESLPRYWKGTMNEEGIVAF